MGSQEKDFSPTVRDLWRHLPLIGARLDYVANRSVAALVYNTTHYIKSFNVAFTGQARWWAGDSRRAWI